MYSFNSIAFFEACLNMNGLRRTTNVCFYDWGSEEVNVIQGNEHSTA